MAASSRTIVLVGQLPRCPSSTPPRPPCANSSGTWPRHWIEFGIDGWRLDVPDEIDDDAFWREFRRRVKAANPEAYIVGEIWDDAQRWLRGRPVRRRDELPVCPRCARLLRPLRRFARNTDPAGFASTRCGAARSPRDRTHVTRYAWPITLAQLNLLDSHDTARSLHQAGGDRDALALALLFLMTMPGAPCIYYGTEIGMTGGHDPDCRRAFPWDEAAWDHGLRDTTRRAIALRQGAFALRRGTFERFYASNDVCTFGRRTVNDAVVVAFNAGHEERTFNVNVGDLLPDGTASDLWGVGTARVLHGTLRNVTLPPRSAAVFGMR